MHLDPWITGEDRTKVFRLFGCSLSPLASRLSPPASGLWPAPDPSAPKGQKEIAQGIAKRRPGYACAKGALDRSHWAIRSAQIWAVFEDSKRDISRISLRTGDRNKGVP